MAEGILEVTTDNFDEQVLQSSRPVLLDFWAPWCGPCKAMAPTLEQLAVSGSGRVTVAKCNVDDHPDIAGRYGIKSIPTLLLFHKGSVADQRVGVTSKAVLDEMIEKVYKGETGPAPFKMA